MTSRARGAGPRRPEKDDARAGVAPRVAATLIVDGVLDAGRSLDDTLADHGASLGDADRALTAAIAYGVLRDRRSLEAMLSPRLARRPQPLLRALLLVGLYQLDAMRVPPHAAVHATVSAAEPLRLGRARGMVNAILRRHQREGSAVADASIGVRLSYPDWLVKDIEQDWGRLAETVLRGGNKPAPMHLRVDARAQDRYRAMATLRDAGIDSEAVRVCASAITLDAPVPAERLPGLATGGLSIQDGAAQLAADLVSPEAGMHVLDACAAPGNKSAHLLERADIDLLSLDIDAERMQTLERTLARGGYPARLQVADACDTAAWWDGRPFDRILLDAPCSGTGVIRRHPDIKWLRRPDDIVAASARQTALLEALWPTLAAGGRLVYATCSVLAAEGVDVIADFLARHGDAVAQPIDARWGFAQRHGRRIAPGMHGFDGFYYAVLLRSPAPA